MTFPVATETAGGATSRAASAWRTRVSASLGSAAAPGRAPAGRADRPRMRKAPAATPVVSLLALSQAAPTEPFLDSEAWNPPALAELLYDSFQPHPGLVGDGLQLFV